MSRPKLSILIIEDNANLVLILKNFLEALNLNVDSSYTGGQGLEMALTNKYDLVIIDIGLPDTNGLHITNRIRSINNKPIIIITGEIHEENEINAYKSRANIYHRKPINFEVLEAQVSSLLPSSVRENIIHSLDVYIDTNRNIFRINDFNIVLTKTEFSFIKMLFNSNGEIFTRENIISRAMDYFHINSNNSVDTMVSRIRKKIRERISHDLIITVNRTGYCINDEYLRNISRSSS